MAATIARISRYPVKGLSAQDLDETTLSPGEPVPHDRRFAVLHGHIHRRYYHPPSSSQPHTFGAGSSTARGHEGYWIIEVKDGHVFGGTQHSPGEVGWPKA